MNIVLGLVECTIFLILSIIHFNWAFGGKWGFDRALPTNEKGEKVINPKRIDSAIVGIGLLIFGLYFLVKTELFSFDLPLWLMKSGAWFISIIFIGRAIGDFKYVGLFKKVRQTEFGRYDTKYYVPLCIVIGLIGLFIAFRS